MFRRFTNAGAYSGSATWGGGRSDRVDSLAIDPTDDVYVAGRFASGSMTVAGTLVSNTRNGRFDVYVARLSFTTTSATFSADWVSRCGGTQHEHVGGLVADGTGVYVCGSFDSNSMAFTGLTTGLSNADTSNNVLDAWVARFEASTGEVSPDCPTLTCLVTTE